VHQMTQKSAPRKACHIKASILCRDNHNLGCRFSSAAVLMCAEHAGRAERVGILGADDGADGGADDGADGGADGGADDGAGPSGSQGSHPDAGWTPFQVYAHSLKAKLCMCNSLSAAFNLSFEGQHTRHFCPSLIPCKIVSYGAQAQLAAWMLYVPLGWLHG